MILDQIGTSKDHSSYGLKNKLEGAKEEAGGPTWEAIIVIQARDVSSLGYSD